MDLEDAVSIHGDEEFDIEKDQVEKEDEKKPKTTSRQTLFLFLIGAEIRVNSQYTYILWLIVLKHYYYPSKYSVVKNIRQFCLAYIEL